MSDIKQNTDELKEILEMIKNLPEANSSYEENGSITANETE